MYNVLVFLYNNYSILEINYDLWKIIFNIIILKIFIIISIL